MIWFDIIKNLISKDEIFEALGLKSFYGKTGENYTLRDMEDELKWFELKADRTLQTLNFMLTTGNQLGVEWEFTYRGGPQWTEISGKVTTDGIIVETPSIRLRQIGVITEEGYECGVTQVTKNGTTIRLCVQPENVMKTTTGDLLVSMLLAYSASKQEGIFKAIPNAEWVFSIAHGTYRHARRNDKILGFQRLSDVMHYHGTSLITNLNWRNIEYSYIQWDDENRAPYDYDDAGNTHGREIYDEEGEFR